MSGLRFRLQPCTDLAFVANDLDLYGTKLLRLQRDRQLPIFHHGLMQCRLQLLKDVRTVREGDS